MALTWIKPCAQRSFHYFLTLEKLHSPLNSNVFPSFLTNAILIENVITTGGWLLTLGIMNKIPSQESFTLFSPVSISEAGVILHLMWTAQAARLLFSLTARSPDLSEPVDVYSDWIDACEAANQ